MNRRFLRSFFDLHDPFVFPNFFHRPMRIQLRQLRPVDRAQLYQRNQPRDPHQVFTSFFDQNGISEAEKEFFKKNYPEKVQQKFDPFKVLQLDKNASQEQIKEAYRKLAIKYHPKNDSSPQAQKKFEELAKAYEEAIQTKNQENYDKLGFKSFFQDFDKQVEEIFGSKRIQQQGKLGEGKQQSVGKDGDKNWGQLYSESSHVQNMNGKQTKYVCQKKYKKDDKLLSVRREETLKDDGKTQIIETIDDGKEVKKKQYILDKDMKKIEEK